VRLYLALEKVEYSKNSKNSDNDSKPLLINKDVKTWSMYTKFGTIVLLVSSDFHLTKIVSIGAFLFLMIGTILFFYLNLQFFSFGRAISSLILFSIAFCER
jgi:hypothetical protein